MLDFFVFFPMLDRGNMNQDKKGTGLCPYVKLGKAEQRALQLSLISTLH